MKICMKKSNGNMTGEGGDRVGGEGVGGTEETVQKR